MSQIEDLLGNEAESLLGHKCETVASKNLHLPGGDFVDRCFKDTNRNAIFIDSTVDIA